MFQLLNFMFKSIFHPTNTNIRLYNICSKRKNECLRLCVKYTQVFWINVNIYVSSAQAQRSDKFYLSRHFFHFVLNEALQKKYTTKNIRFFITNISKWNWIFKWNYRPNVRSDSNIRFNAKYSFQFVDILCNWMNRFYFKFCFFPLFFSTTNSKKSKRNGKKTAFTLMFD